MEARGVMLRRHCRQEFMKHVLPWFGSKVTIRKEGWKEGM
jgi:hypothetical protein